VELPGATQASRSDGRPLGTIRSPHPEEIASDHLDDRLRAGSRELGAYVPALPGLGVAGETRKEVEQLIREGIPFHLQGLIEESLPIP
jgi:hypothetical protein